MRSDLSRELTRALARIDRPGSFAASGSEPAVLPGLEVDGLGPVALPLTAAQAAALKKRCEQAPYGKGEQTLVDTSVRRVWRLKPERFALSNPDWGPFLGGVVARVQEELGLEKQKLSSHLYELLFYEPGSFFLAHRDGEKLDRMVATLVVVLPSDYRGGELVVRHDGQERVIDFGAGDSGRFKVHYAAFYADCEHEVRPVREGHRLCLVYNLTLAKKGKAPPAPGHSEHVEAVGRLLRRWAEGEEAGKLVVTLDHQYTQDGLAWDALKGVDRARARVLAEAAREAGCRAHLALLTLWEAGQAEYAGSGGGWYDEDEGDDGEYEMGELIDSSLSADGWIDGDGERLAIGPLGVDKDEVLDPEKLQQVAPEQDVDGYTGNEGLTMERWYRHAVVVLWPEKAHVRALCAGDGRRAVPALEKLVARWKKARGAEADALRAQCLSLARGIIAEWRASDSPAWRGESAEAPGDPLPLLAALGEPKLIAAYLREVPARDAEVELAGALPAIGDSLGWATFQPELEALFRATTEETVERNGRALEQLCLAKPRRPEGWSELCRSLADALVGALEAVDQSKAAPGDWRPRKKDRAARLTGLARALLATEQERLLARAVAHALATPEKYPLTEAHVASLLELAPWLKRNVKRPSPALAGWVASCREELEKRTAEEPRPPADLARDATFRCACADCAELKQFLRDPGERVHRFRVREDRRQHLTEMIRRHQLDANCSVVKTGSPHTLVCTKNEASYHARLATYHKDQGHLAKVRAIEAALPG